MDDHTGGAPPLRAGSTDAAAILVARGRARPARRRGVRVRSVAKAIIAFANLGRGMWLAGRRGRRGSSTAYKSELALDQFTHLSLRKIISACRR